MPIHTGKLIPVKIRPITGSGGSMSARFILHASAAAFITYLSMYAFRKPFTAATFEGLSIWGVSYKILLILFQLLGYTISKYIGIKYISEMSARGRMKALVVLMLAAWSALFFFAIIPPPYNLPFMLLNGLPLGMIWGVVFGYLEGRRSTEMLGAAMASSFILSSGIVRSVGSILLEEFNVTEMWMPFIAGSIFIPVLFFGMFMLNTLKEPDIEDRNFRTERIPMNAKDRKSFFRTFAPGIILSLIIYVGLTVFRDLRDNFAVEFWHSAGYSGKSGILIFTEIPIAISVLAIISSIITIRDNKVAFFSNFLIMMVCGISLILCTVAFKLGIMGPVSWMIIAGFSMYMPYLAYHTLYFERWIACFRVRANAGYLMYVMDAAGYLGSILILLFKNFAAPSTNWVEFFIMVTLVIGVLLLAATWYILRYFRRLHYSLKHESHS